MALMFRVWAPLCKSYCHIKVRIRFIATQVADMLEAAVARSNPDDAASGQQADKAGLLPKGLRFPKDPVSAAKKVATTCATDTSCCHADGLDDCSCTCLALPYCRSLAEKRAWY